MKNNISGRGAASVSVSGPEPYPDPPAPPCPPLRKGRYWQGEALFMGDWQEYLAGVPYRRLHLTVWDWSVAPGLYRNLHEAKLIQSSNYLPF